MKASPADILVVQPCVGSGFCCKKTPCPYGAPDPVTGGCVHLVPWEDDDLEAPRYRCGRYEFIVRQPGAKFVPAFGAGCCMPLFNDARDEVLRALVRPFGRSLWRVSTRGRRRITPARCRTSSNPGLECIYGDSEGLVLENPRGNAYSLRVREYSDWIAAAGTQWDEIYRRNQLGRYQERFARRVKDLIYSRVLPRLGQYETILISKMSKRAAQGRQTRISVNDEGGYVSAMSLLEQLAVQRYGLYDPVENPTGRVREREAAGASRKCSRCRAEHPTRFQRNNQRKRDQHTDCPNPRCPDRSIHVDVNHARNVLADFEAERAAA